MRVVLPSAALAGVMLFLAGPVLVDAQVFERAVFVSVLNKDSRAVVPDLDADTFVVREDNVRREVLRVTPATTPMAVAVLVDNSQAATPTIADLRRGLEAFLQRIAGIGPVALISVADRPTILQDYTTDSERLLQAARKLFPVPDSGATLLDGVVEVSRGLRRREEERIAIVAISTENVEFSTLHYEQVLDPLEESGASFHPLVLVNPQGSMTGDAARNRSTVFDRGPRESGGARWDVLTSMAYETRLAQLADSLKSQYRVVYSRPQSLIPPKRLEVSVTNDAFEAFAAPARGQKDAR